MASWIWGDVDFVDRRLIVSGSRMKKFPIGTNSSCANCCPEEEKWTSDLCYSLTSHRLNQPQSASIRINQQSIYWNYNSNASSLQELQSELTYPTTRIYNSSSSALATKNPDGVILEIWRSAGGKMTGFSKIIGKTCKKCENAYFLNGDIQSSLLTGHMTWAPKGHERQVNQARRQTVSSQGVQEVISVSQC